MFSAKPETEEGKKDIAMALANRSAVLIKVNAKLLWQKKGYIYNFITILYLKKLKLINP